MSVEMTISRNPEEKNRQPSGLEDLVTHLHKIRFNGQQHYDLVIENMQRGPRGDSDDCLKIFKD